MSIFQAEPQPGDIKNAQEGAQRAVDPVADNAGPDPIVAADPPPPAPAVDDRPEPPARRVPGVDRAEMARKFAERRARHTDDVAFDGSFAKETVYAGSLTQQVADEPEPEPQPEPGATSDSQDPPARASGPSDSQDPPVAPRFKVKVRHEERELTQDELIAAAQKTLAADDYLGEARTLLEEAKRVASSGPHQDRADPAHTPNPSDPDPDQPHQDDAHAAIEKIQFGTPDEAVEAFQSAVAKAVAKAVDPDQARKAVYLHHREQDVGRSVAVYERFLAEPENAALLKDPDNEAVLQNKYYGEIAKDLRQIGLPADQIPKDRDALVEAHRFHRIHGRPVRDTAKLLADSKQAFVEWKGGPRPQPQPEPAPRPNNGVVISNDRADRRLRASHQPMRASAPPAPTARTQVPATRSAAVAKMLKNRGKAIVT